MTNESLTLRPHQRLTTGLFDVDLSLEFVPSGPFVPIPFIFLKNSTQPVFFQLSCSRLLRSRSRCKLTGSPNPKPILILCLFRRSATLKRNARNDFSATMFLQQNTERKARAFVKNVQSEIKHVQQIKSAVHRSTTVNRSRGRQVHSIF